MISIAIAISFFLASIQPHPAQPVQSDQAEIVQLRQQVAELKVRMDQSDKQSTENTTVIRDLDKRFVPRAEHDLRDASLNVANRINRIEDGQKTLDESIRGLQNGMLSIQQNISDKTGKIYETALTLVIGAAVALGAITVRSSLGKKSTA